jgi:hypothetical protein
VPLVPQVLLPFDLAMTKGAAGAAVRAVADAARALAERDASVA